MNPITGQPPYLLSLVLDGFHVASRFFYALIGESGTFTPTDVELSERFSRCRPWGRWDPSLLDQHPIDHGPDAYQADSVDPISPPLGIEEKVSNT